MMIKKILKRVYYFFKSEDNSYLKKGVDCNKIWYGNSYGGFFVHPDIIGEKSIVYSFGIGEDISFDKEMIERHQSEVFGFDPTPKSINWLAKNRPEGFSFFEFGLSNEAGFVDFYLPQNDEYVSGSTVLQEFVDNDKKISVEMKRLETIVEELGHDRIDVLKMDIEGSEYGVIDDLLKLDIEIGQILIEFHTRFFDDGHKKTKRAIRKMKKGGYEIFGISASKQELSFVNKKILNN